MEPRSFRSSLLGIVNSILDGSSPSVDAGLPLSGRFFVDMTQHSQLRASPFQWSIAEWPEKAAIFATWPSMPATRLSIFSRAALRDLAIYYS